MRTVVIATALLVVALGSLVAWRLRQVPASDDAKRARIEAMVEDYRSEIGDVPTVTVSEVLARRDEGEPLVFVDAREADERAVSTIPGAVPLEQVERHPDRYRDRTLVTYCTIGYRSGLATRRLVAEGLDAVNLEGSLLLWAHEGGAIEGPSGPTTEVHVYGPRWNLLPDGYTSVW